MSKQIIAARISSEGIQALRTLEDPIISLEELVFQIKMGESYFVIVDGIKHEFVLNKKGDSFEKPTPEILKKVNQF